MPTYTVYFRTFASHAVTIDLPEGMTTQEIEESAAQKIDPGIGHQARIDLGDWEPVSCDIPKLAGEPSVYDEDGEPVTDPED